MRTSKLAVAVAALALSSGVAAHELQRQLEMELRASGTGYGGFSAERGREFFYTARGRIGAPPAPGASAAMVEKWLAQSCTDVLRRVCTSQEKGDILQYLMSPREGR